MKTRFRKVWCSSCSTMQFAGECPHPQSASREVRPSLDDERAAHREEKRGPNLMDQIIEVGRQWAAHFATIPGPPAPNKKRKTKKKAAAEART